MENIIEPEKKPYYVVSIAETNWYHHYDDRDYYDYDEANSAFEKCVEHAKLDKDGYGVELIKITPDGEDGFDDYLVLKQFGLINGRWIDHIVSVHDER